MQFISSGRYPFFLVTAFSIMLCLVQPNCPSQVQAAWQQAAVLVEQNTLESEEYLLSAGEILNLRVHQKGQDVALVLSGKGYRLLVDHNLWTLAPEVLWMRAPVAGTYKVSILAVGDPVTSEKARLESTLFPASDQRAATVANTFLRWRQRVYANQTQIPPWQPKDPLFREFGPSLNLLADQMVDNGEPVLAGRIRLDEAKRNGKNGNWAAQTEAYFLAVRCFLQARELHWALHGAQTAALTQRDRGAFQLALNHSELALGIARLQGEPETLGRAQNTLGRVYVRMGRFEDAIAAYQTAMNHYQTPESAENQAESQLNMGLALVQVGRWATAEKNLRQVCGFWKQRQRPARAGKAMLELGWLFHLRREYQAALSWYDEAQQTWRNRPLATAGLLDRWASTLTQLGRYEEAEAKYRKALSAFQAANDPTHVAHVAINLADLLRRSGRLTRAMVQVQAGLRTFQSQKAHIETAYALRIQGKIQAASGALAEADQSMSQGLDNLNQVLVMADNHFLTRSFNQVYHEVLTDLVDLKMRRHDADPPGGHSRDAFVLLDRQRAWTLRRQIVNRGVQPRSSKSQSAYNHGPGAVFAGLATGETQTSDHQFDRLFEYYQRIQKKTEPRASAKAYSFKQLQNSLQANQTALVFSLHEELGYLWELTNDDFRTHHLPTLAEIQALVEPFYNLSAQPALPFQRVQRENLAGKITATLLDQLELAKTKPNWVIVADGALNRLPWAALVDPSQKGDVLIKHRSLAFLPSLSTGSDLRHRQGHRSRARLTLLALGDAAYDGEDSQFTTDLDPEGMFVDLSPQIRADFSKNLIHSGPEVRTIGGLFANQQTTLVTGTAVNVQALQKLGMDDYQIIHFATHGFHHPEFGDLSGLVLSRVDSAGKPMYGLVQAVDIQDWHLKAQLVALSACDTGLGESFRGEGVWGLGQAMMIAGASRVLTSLWAVRDETTKELMIAFYENMVKRRLAPPQALKVAQAEMANRPETADPYFWSGFVIQGLSESLDLVN